ncbi:MAG TPA: alpha/beta hydrolase [Gemmatimonadaceae bacterium]|nr:alpha/beta hydrolase [Gemmatimonadaceae bacterium]
MPRSLSTLPLALVLATSTAAAQTSALPAPPSPLGIPKPGPVTDAPYAPQPILPGGIVIPLYPSGSPFLNAKRVREAEVYNVSQTVPGRINSIVNIHNPSIEFHPVDRGVNTGAVVILVAGGGHNSLNVGGESADFVPFFYQYGVNTVILRNRLRRDGYDAQIDAVRDAQQAIRLVRGYAKAWNVDPNRIGIIGFSAGAELSAPSALSFDEFDRRNAGPSDPLAGVSSRPDFVGIIYPGPTPFSVRNPTGPSTSAARNPTPPPIPRNAPPAFMATAGSGDRIHALWAMDYAYAMLDASVPNVEIHVYGNGRHPGDSLPDGGRMTGGLSAANTRPMSTWQYRFIDWFRDLGFLQMPGVETKAARDVARFVRSRGQTP